MARDKQFKSGGKKTQLKAKDKKTQRMTRDGLMELNQTTGEEQRVSQRGQEFQLRQSAPAQEAASVRGELQRAGRFRQQTLYLQAQPFIADSENPYQRLQTHTAGMGFEASVTEMDFGTTPADTSLPRQAHDAPVTSSPGHSSAPAAERNDSGSHPYPTEGGRLQEERRRPDVTAPKHRQGSSGYYQRFQEISPSAAHEQRTANAAASEQTEHHPTATTEGTLATASAAPPTEEPLPIRAAREVSAEEPVSGAPESAPPIPERPGRLRYEAGTAPTAAKKQRQSGTKYAQKFTQKTEPAPTAADPDNTATDTAQTDTDAPESGEHPPTHTDSTAPDSGTAQPGKKQSRLKFGAEELPPETALDRKISKLQGKAQKTDTELKKAQEQLPTKKRMRTERTFSAEKGKPQRKIYFEREVKSQREHLKGPLPTRPAKAGANALIGIAHGKIHQVEQENVGVEAGHKAELIAEGALRHAYRQHKTAPYRRAERLSHKSSKQHVKLTYQEALRDNPKLRGNMLSRFMQKRKIKRQYAKAARESKRAAAVAKKTGKAAAAAGKAGATFAKQHPAALATVALALLLVFLIMTMFGSCTNITGGVLASVLGSSYLAEDRDIDDTELSYTDWEAELQLEIDNAKRDHPGYDEYRFELDEIGHDPYELLAYLTARYQDYTYAEIQGELREIFAEQYTLEFVEEVEIRCRENEDGEEEPYEWTILNTILTTKPLSAILAPRVDEEQRETFDTLLDTRGNRQYTISPLGFDWLPNITSSYGWRVHPISGAKDFHNAVDIAVPQGTPILAGHDGKVVNASYDAAGYGWYVTLEGKNGLSTRYAHCSSLLVRAGQEVKQGETIARSGNTGNSTGPHLHFEVRINGGTLNPLFFSLTDNTGREE